MKRNNISNQFNEFDIALYHLIFIGNSIVNTINAFAKIIDKADEQHERALYVSTFSNVLIQVVSFMDEYNNHIKSPDKDLNATIISIKKAVKPAADQINEWKEIRDFRNIVLAHNLRDRKRLVSVFERGLTSFDIPKSGGDLAVLGNCISMIKRTFESAFRTKLQSFQQTLDLEHLPSPKGKFNNSNETDAAVNKILNQINSNILQLKIDAGVL